MPISVDSSGGVAFDYSIRNVNKIDSTNNTEIRQEEKQESSKTQTQTQVRQELPKDEVEALFFNRQDSQLTRDILNTYASSQDSSNEISFTNLDAYEKLLQNSQPEREPEPAQNIQPRPERAEREPEISSEPVPQREDTREPALAQNTEPRPETSVEREQEVNTEPAQPSPQSEAASVNQTDDVTNNL